MRYIRLFDVISELYWVLLRRRRRFEKTLAFEDGKYPGAQRASCSQLCVKALKGPFVSWLFKIKYFEKKTAPIGLFESF